MNANAANTNKIGFLIQIGFLIKANAQSIKSIATECGIAVLVPRNTLRVLGKKAAYPSDWPTTVLFSRTVTVIPMKGPLSRTVSVGMSRFRARRVWARPTQRGSLIASRISVWPNDGMIRMTGA